MEHIQVGVRDMVRDMNWSHLANERVQRKGSSRTSSPCLIFSVRLLGSQEGFCSLDLIISDNYFI